jgi:CRISPR/Cas system CMR subunit Cmr4 (Cas7 group RAMP superfamily)
MENIRYKVRFLARFVVEAATPLCVGSGETNFLTDAVVALDVNGLPYIPGSALAGVLRHAFEPARAEALFGASGTADAQGSAVIVSEARLVGIDGEPIDGLQRISFDHPFYARFLSLPVRQHVRIGHRGAAEQGGKFDGQVVCKGVRFCFELEMQAEDVSRESDFRELINRLGHASLRIGGGTRNGFGELTVRSLQTAVLNLTDPASLDAYLAKSSRLTDGAWSGWRSDAVAVTEAEGLTHYELRLTPDDFFLFGSGVSDGELDKGPVREAVVVWDDKGHPHFEEGFLLVPATSVKGALAHRTAYHYNRLSGRYADSGEDADFEALTNQANKAVTLLFGTADDRGDAGGEGATRAGRVLLSDLFLAADEPTEVLRHVCLDRFTGGAQAGALFDERVACIGRPLTMHLYVRRDAEAWPEEVDAAFEAALCDLCDGMLPLGGGAGRGHGFFDGQLIKDGKEITL